MEYRLSGSGVPSDPRDRRGPRRPPPGPTRGQPSPGPDRGEPPPRPTGSSARPLPRSEGCPICGSSACGERVATLVAANTAESHSIGVFTLGKETGVTTNWTSSRSALAAMLTPPSPPTVYPQRAESLFWLGLVLYGLVFFLVALSLGITVGDGAQAVDPFLGLALGAGLVAFFVWSAKTLHRCWTARHAADAASYPERRARFDRGVADWNQAVYCRRTGSVWIPSTRQALPAGDALDVVFHAPHRSNGPPPPTGQAPPSGGP